MSNKKPIDSHIKLQEEIESIIEDNFAYLLDTIDFYTELYYLPLDHRKENKYLIHDSNAMGIDIEFVSKSHHQRHSQSINIWEDYKYDIATLIDILNNLCDCGITLVISGEKKQEIYLKIFKGDLTEINYDRDEQVTKIEIKMVIYGQAKSKSIIDKFKDFIK